MNAECLVLDADGRLRPEELETLLARGGEKGASVWIDVTYAQPDRLVSLLKRLEISDELIDTILEQGHAARIVPLEGGLYFEIPLEISGSPAEVRSVRFLCRNGLLVTMRRDHIRDEVWVDRSRLMHREFGTSAAEELVCDLLIALSLILKRQSLELRHELVSLSDRLDDAEESVGLPEIVGLKRRIVDLDAVTEEREATLEAMRDAAQIFRSSETLAERLNIALSNTSATARRLDRLDRRAEAIQMRWDALGQEKINRRLGRLTIISAIFLPLTLIAGIYGMNFEVMPELSFPYAYPVALGGMALIGVGLWFWFSRQGWMD